MSSIKIKTRINDWYQDDEIEHVAEAVAKLSRTHRLIGFGGSMGAFGLINYADRMNLHSVIASAPQFSIDASVPPYEKRWQAERSLIDFKRHRIAGASRRARGWILYDPTTIDAAHARLINVHHDLAMMPLAYSHHFPLALLQQCNLLGPMLKEIVADLFDVHTFLKRVRSARRQSSWYWFNLSRSLGRHRRTAAALRAARRSVELPDWQPVQTAWHLTDLLVEIGRFDEAIATMQPFTHRNDEYGADARQRIARWKEGRP